MVEDRSYFSQHYEEQVQPCIDLVDSLRSLGVEQDLALPAIAVIGDQSSGKSSKLCARSPLWGGTAKGHWHCYTLPFGAEVEESQQWHCLNALAGEGKNISHEMINLEIHATNVPDLTLIDLPGIARVATGNQSHDIEEQIKSLIETFIKKEETINLVVVPANVDIATTDALKMAETVDPEGQRTLGILTKPDLVDKGAEEGVVSILNNQVVPLKKGYMLVKCRGQQDINDNMPLAKALEKERKFFTDHTHFRYNQFLTDMVRAEEDIGDSHTRVFTKMRTEFSLWKIELDKKNIQVAEQLDAEMMEYARIHRGKELPGFGNYKIFEELVRGHVVDLKEPALHRLQSCKANQVPLIILYHMLEQYTAKVKAAMLGIVRHKDAESFTRERSAIAQKRTHLLGTMERLKKARQVLVNFVLSA
ncbi:hypothetical protein ACEWY4_023255 [Coilia grayii]|uniref:Uncharacterized protein n=1 Tax=Coilia grayii TaxID=363190 RepID=A0ABD1J2R8_9TELE